MKGHKLQRTPEAIRKQMNLMDSLGWSYVVQHGTYTTKIITPNGAMTYSTIEFSNKVFVAANMVRKDCLNTPEGQKIIHTKHSKVNYANHPTLDWYEHPWVYNIDIKGAYASCLYNNHLITEKTFLYLQNLPKEERLPAVGMLAKSHIKYFYQDKKCVKVETYRSETSELFFYLIQKIDEVMREIKWILGDYFVFYWVDGVFFKWETPEALIIKVKKFLEQEGYRYTCEDVSNFVFAKDNDQCEIYFKKDGEAKSFLFRSSSADDHYIKEMLYKKAIRSI